MLYNIKKFKVYIVYVADNMQTGFYETGFNK